MQTEYIRKNVALDALKAQADTMRTWVERYAEQRRGVLTAVNIIEDVEPDNVVPYLLYPDGSLSIKIPEGMTVSSVFIHQGGGILCGMMNLLPNRMR